jgi:hypothetical protein
MARAGGYVLYLETERRNVFSGTLLEGETFSEPVGDFVHARTAPLICFVVLDGQHITHIASGRRGLRAGTGLRRLNVVEAQRLNVPIPISNVVAQLDSRTRARAAGVFQSGGLFTPKAFESAIDAVSAASEEARPLLQRFSRLRRELIGRLSAPTRRVLGEQKEAVLSALAFAGIDRREIHEWSPPSEGQPASFLDGLPNAVMREDAMIVNDLVTVPGMDLVRTTAYTGAVFEGRGKRLTVILANRLPLEQLTGTDLIYFNETHRSFVMVQYKAMNQESGAAAFRLPDDGLTLEIERMQAMSAQLHAIQPAASKENFRLNPEAFYIKLCARSQFNPDDIKLFPGMYFSLSQWLCVAEDPSLLGPRGGRVVTYETAGRYMDNDLFIKLVAQAWIGTHAEQSELLAVAIRATLESGRAVALAIEAPVSHAHD